MTEKHSSQPHVSCEAHQ